MKSKKVKIALIGVIVVGCIALTMLSFHLALNGDLQRLHGG